MAGKNISARRMSTSRKAKKILKEKKTGKRSDRGGAEPDHRPTGRKGGIGGVVIFVVLLLIVISSILAAILD